MKKAMATDKAVSGPVVWKYKARDIEGLPTRVRVKRADDGIGDWQASETEGGFMGFLVRLDATPRDIGYIERVRAALGEK